MRDFPISQITVTRNRFRKDLGDVDELAQDIKENGLYHPILINQTGELIAGLRRLQACRMLGSRKIPVKVLNTTNGKIIEINENTKRKDFTVSEIAAIAHFVEKTRIGHRPQKVSESDTFLHRGPTNKVVEEITGVSHDTIGKIKKIEKAAKENPKKYAHILERVDAKKLSVDSAHKLVTRKERNLPKAKMPPGKFDVILCDVPIGYKDQGGRGAANNHYETMTPLDLIRLDVPSAKNAILFFWMSPSIMYDTIEIVVSTVDDDGKEVSAILKVPIYKAILDAWGFEVIKGEFAWDKGMIGLGSWNRNQHENCLIAIKGKIPPPAELFSSVIQERRTKKHSKKPESFIGMIEKMYPRRKYLELFGRERRKKWAVFGNQIEEPEAGLQDKCRCGHTKIMHNGDHKGNDNAGFCVYRGTCHCDKFIARKKRLAKIA